MKITDGDTDAVGAQFDHVTLRPGQHVGRYRIVSVLGQGGFGVTYRAVDSELSRDVAIKEYLPASLAIRQDGTTVMPRSTSAAEDFAWGRERFVAEGRTLAALQRAPGIVLVHDFLEAHGTAYLVMELVAGRTLHEQVAQQGPLDAAALDGILWRLLDGLAAVHAAGFLHRDIKPANILLDAEGRATLIDFGASRVAVAGRSQAMTAVFTPGFGAVEQFTAATQGPWTDIYGLAATLHYAITGAPPPNAIDRILDDTLAPLAAGKWPFPPALLAGIDAGLAVRADKRPQSIAEWRALLSATEPARPVVAPAPVTVVMSSATASPAASPPPPVPPPATTRKRPVLIAASAVAAIGLAAAGWFVLRSQPPSTPTPSASTQSASAPPAIVAPTPAPAPTPTAVPPPVAVPPATQDQTQALLDEARRAQQAAVEEAARLRSEAEARRKADEETAMRRRIEEEMRQKAAAEEAARRQAAEAAQRKAEAEAAERLKAEEADRAGAEAAEAALRLSTVDRQRIQVALTAMGFSTSHTDGVFGPRTREMIAAWQKKVGRAATGYLTADAQAALLRDAGPAVARWDEEQRAPAATMAARPAPPPSPPPPARANASCDGTFTARWCRAAYQGFPPSCWSSPATIANGVISGGWTSSSSGHRQTFEGRIDGNGGVQITYNGIGTQTYVNHPFVAVLTGTVSDRVLKAAGRAGSGGRDFNVTIQCR